MVEDPEVARLHLVAHEVAHLIVPHRIPAGSTVALEVVDRIHVGFALEKPETRHAGSVSAWRRLYTADMRDPRFTRLAPTVARALGAFAIPVGFAIAFGEAAASPSVHVDGTRAFADTPAPPPGDRREVARREAERRLRDSMLPAPMSKDRFTSMIAAIDASLAENAELAEAYARYVADAKALGEAASERIAGRLAAAFTFEAARETFEPRPNPELVESLAVRNRWAEQLNAIERALFRAIALAAAPERKLRIAEERLAWIDERSERDAVLPSTRMTLLEIVHRARLEADALRALEPTLVAHAERLVALREAREQGLREGALDRARIETEAGTLWREGTPQMVDATNARLLEIDARELRAEIAVRELHFATLRRIRGQLPADAGRRVMEEWQRSVHPELFDDERMVATLVRALLAIPERDAAGDEVLLELVDTAYRRLEPLGREAATVADSILPGRGAGRVPLTLEDRVEEIDARLRLIDLQSRRRTVLRDLVTRVRSGLPAEAADARAQVALLANSLAALERADGFDRTSLRALSQALQAAIDAERDARGQTDAESRATTPDSATPARP